MTWQWLKNTQEQWSFGRIMPFVLFIVSMFEIPVVLLFGRVETIYACIFAISPMLCGMYVYSVEILREIKSFTVKIGDKEYGVKNGEKK